MHFNLVVEWETLDFEVWIFSCKLVMSYFLVIALAWGRDLQSLCYAGIIGIFDPPRVGCVEAVEVVQSAGVHVKMITGDSLETACSIGKFLKIIVKLIVWILGSRLKIYSNMDSILSGPQIDEMSDVDLERVIKGVTIFCRATPRHKLRIVKVIMFSLKTNIFYILGIAKCWWSCWHDWRRS